MCNIFTYKILYRFLKGIKVVQPLNYFDYKKEDSMKILENEYGWLRYEQKHYESRFTKFYEGFWLLKKFGFDKRKAHYSSLILSNQMSRDEAIKKLEKDPINERDAKNEFSYVCKKLEISEDELNLIMNGKNKSFKDYKSLFKIIQFFAKILHFFKLESRLIR